MKNNVELTDDPKQTRTIGDRTGAKRILSHLPGAVILLALSIFSLGCASQQVGSVQTAQTATAQSAVVATAESIIKQTTIQTEVAAALAATAQVEQTLTASAEVTQTAVAQQTETAKQVSAPPLIANYSLDSDANDATQQNEPIVLENAPFQDTGVYCNGGYQTEDACEIRTPFLEAMNLNAFSIAAQFKTDTRRLMPVFVGSSYYRWAAFYLTEDGTVALEYNNSEYVACDLQYELNTWHEALLTYDGTTGRLYLDGELGCEVDFVMEHGDQKEITTTDYSSGMVYEGILGDLRVYDGVWVP